MAEGLDVFRVPVPKWLEGRTLAATDLRSITGCNVVGLVRNGSDRVEPAPTAHEPVPAGASLVIVGDSEAQEQFYRRGD